MCVFVLFLFVCLFFEGRGVEGYIGVSVMFLASDIWGEGWGCTSFNLA